LRFNFAMQIATQRQREFVRRDELNGWLKQHDIHSADGVLEHFAALLLDGDLPPDARRSLLDYMNRDTRNELTAAGFKLTPDTINSKVRGLMHMMMTMPEYQLA